MIRSHSTKSLKMLVDLYQHRLTLANRRVTQQAFKVSEIRNELAERKAIVAGLNEQMLSNWKYVEATHTIVDSKLLHFANRHRYWVDYDKQRESFYLDLTVSELDDALKELDMRRKAVRKLKTKTDALVKIMGNATNAAEMRRELNAEDEAQSMNVARQLNHV